MKRAAVFLADVVDRADAGMIERARGLCFPVEAVARNRIVRDPIGKELERDKPMQPAVLGPVDHTHAAFAEDFEKPIVRDGMTDHGSKILRLGEGQVNEGHGLSSVFDDHC